MLPSFGRAAHGSRWACPHARVDVLRLGTHARAVGCIFCAAPFAKYNADGTGRDTYIRRDPVECFGKSLYVPEPRLVTRFGAAGSAVSRERGRKPGETDPVGGPNTAPDFSRPARFIRPKSDEYPVEINQFTTMKEMLQDAHVSSQQPPGYNQHISSYAGFKPRCPPAHMGSAEWNDVGGP